MNTVFFLALALHYVYRTTLLVFPMQYDDFEDSDGVTSEGKCLFFCASWIAPMH